MPSQASQRFPILALGFAGLLGLALLISPQSPVTQTSGFSLALDLDDSEGDQSISSLDVSPGQLVSIQLFGANIRDATGISVRFRYEAVSVVYEGFDPGEALPNAHALVQQDSTSVCIDGSFLGGSASVNAGLVGTVRFRTTPAFTDTEIWLVHAELARGEQAEVISPSLGVALQAAARPSPDFDGSGLVGFADFVLFAGAFGAQIGRSRYVAAFDLNNDGSIGFDDLLIFAESFGDAVNRAPVFAATPPVTRSVAENTLARQPIGDAVAARDADGTGPWSKTMFTHSSTWLNFVKAKTNGTEPILPDFSYAGHHYFSKPVSNVTHQRFNVTDYGAIPNDSNSDHSAIQAAIAAAEANGSGVVFFAAGEFLVNTDRDTTDEGEHTPIYIRQSNIVLKSSGSRDGGTVIRQVNYLPEANPGDKWTVPFMFTFEPADWPAEHEWGTTSTPLASITQDAVRETFWITVSSASQLNVGQWIVLHMENTAAVDDFLHPYSIDNAWEFIRDTGIRVSEKHSIAEIDGTRVRLNEPLHALKIEADHGWTVHAFLPILEEVGVEDISFHGSWLDNFVHHRNYIHNSGWSLLAFRGCVNSWMRRLSFVNTNRAYTVHECAAISVYQITTSGNPGHFSSRSRASYGIWYGLMEELAGHWHGLNVMTNATGNVYWRSDQIENQTMDCHSSQPYANLYDLINRGKLSDHGGERVGTTRQPRQPLGRPGSHDSHWHPSLSRAQTDSLQYDPPCGRPPVYSSRLFSADAFINARGFEGHQRGSAL